MKPWWLGVLVACGEPTEVAVDGPPGSGLDASTGFDASTGYDASIGYAEWVKVCAKHYGDPISEKFCAGDLQPSLRSIADLELLLGMSYNAGTGTASMATGLSTGIGLRAVTPLNPRVILVRNYSDPRYTVLAFARGEPLVELAAPDLAAQTIRFFVVRFQLPCESTPRGCNSADLLTPTIESSWKGYTLYDDEALANTVLDCNTCHQPDGSGTRKLLRMQERQSPWTHWFGTFRNRADLFTYAHASEPTYAGYPVFDVSRIAPGVLESLLEVQGFVPQPNEFDAPLIDQELAATGTSATWQAIYDNAVNGLAIPPPYFGVDQTDPTQVTAMADAYRAVMAGTLPRDQLPDIRGVLLESALPAMSIRPRPGLDGRGILVHMCSQCHNSRLDQTLTRARFNVMTLDAMSRQERDTAILRLQLPDDNPAKMPPPRFRTLSSEERALVIAELSR